MARQRAPLQHDPREVPTSVGPMHDSKAGTKPIVDGPPKGPPQAVPGRSKKAKVSR